MINNSSIVTIKDFEDIFEYFGYSKKRDDYIIEIKNYMIVIIKLFLPKFKWYQFKKKYKEKKNIQNLKDFVKRNSLTTLLIEWKVFKRIKI